MDTIHKVNLSDLVHLRPEGVLNQFQDEQDIAVLVYEFPASPLSNILLLPPKGRRFGCRVYLGQSHADWMAMTPFDQQLVASLRRGIRRQGIDLAYLPWCFVNSALNDIGVANTKVTADLGDFEIIATPTGEVEFALSVAQMNFPMLLDWSVPVKYVPPRPPVFYQKVRSAIDKPGSWPSESGAVDLMLATPDDDAKRSACDVLAQAIEAPLLSEEQAFMLGGREAYLPLAVHDGAFLKAHADLRYRLDLVVRTNALRASLLATWSAPHYSHLLLQRHATLESGLLKYLPSCFDALLQLLRKYPDCFSDHGIELTCVQTYLSSTRKHYPVLGLDPFRERLPAPSGRIMSFKSLDWLFGRDPLTWSVDEVKAL